MFSSETEEKDPSVCFQHTPWSVNRFMSQHPELRLLRVQRFRSLLCDDPDPKTFPPDYPDPETPDQCSLMRMTHWTFHSQNNARFALT